MSITRPLLSEPEARARTAKALIAGAVALAAWAIYLGASLPPGPHHSWSSTWTGLDNLALTWAGLDGIECIALTTLGVAMLLDRPLLASVTGLLALPVFALDAWFDVMTSLTRGELDAALAMAALAEIPLALLLALIARHEMARAVSALSPT
ncbi:hypothetical protein [Actinopolymorpha rutila]|uniref:Uncharacterized protein n=1 Tax=Actinopolymorpha rutila TaxID=446787 RepID=A0A852Z475_9ACTN|nr:hypothetical protein [Actinopolymorpha rutila]NYH87621.1 hypothetical protein [Actinopolymorpha rutila]